MSGWFVVGTIYGFALLFIIAFYTGVLGACQ